MNKLLLAAAGFAVTLSSAALAQAPHAHGRGDGVQTRAEVTAHVQRLFARVDVDRDGFITQAEGQAALARMDGRRRNGATGQSRRPGSLALRMFTMADANGDKRISRAEADAAALQHFDLADRNRDGRITADERQQLRAHFGQRG